jgi:hypothetical protein
MCCAKNRSLALFGACLAICASSASALLSSHERESASQVAPQQDERIPELEHRIGEAEKRLDAQRPASDPAGKSATSKPAR